jgi:ubiquinone/menaquinone biosynthesis C-methylase UbiE
MFNQIYTILTTTNPNLFFLRWVLILALIIVLVLITNYYKPTHISEGFIQTEPYIFKQGNVAIDEFYVDIYDSLHSTIERSQQELIKIVEMTDPSTQHSTMLDIGCGTGSIVNELTDAGYDVYGIDKSKDMLKYAQTTYPDAEFVHGDIMNSMQFEKSTFTHILCTYFTIYQFDDKPMFFRNCYHWMKPNTYLVLHLVDTDNFTNMIPHKQAYNEEKNTKNKRIITSNAIFSDYKYKCSCDIPKDNDNICTEVKETFIDMETDHVRQNEFHLYMEKISTILDIAKQNGFIQHGKASMKGCNGDENQYLYILERPL